MTQALLEADTHKIAEAHAFVQGFSSVIISSVTKSGEPHSSYAPYITDNDKFYVYVSGLAQHANTLRNGTACLFFIENEHQAKTLFARKRLTINCEVSTVQPGELDYERLLDAMQTKHGSTLKLLRNLPDFILFELHPRRASYVTGFGAAYDLSNSLTTLTKTVE